MDGLSVVGDGVVVVGDGVDGVGLALSVVSSGRRRTNSINRATTVPPRIAHRTQGFTRRGYPSFSLRHAVVSWLRRPTVRPLR